MEGEVRYSTAPWAIPPTVGLGTLRLPAMPEVPWELLLLAFQDAVAPATWRAWMAWLPHTDVSIPFNELRALAQRAQHGGGPTKRQWRGLTEPPDALFGPTIPGALNYADALRRTEELKVQASDAVRAGRKETRGMLALARSRHPWLLLHSPLVHWLREALAAEPDVDDVEVVLESWRQAGSAEGRVKLPKMRGQPPKPATEHGTVYRMVGDLRHRPEHRRDGETVISKEAAALAMANAYGAAASSPSDVGSEVRGLERRRAGGHIAAVMFCGGNANRLDIPSGASWADVHAALIEAARTPAFERHLQAVCGDGWTGFKSKLTLKRL